jgi:hypothetical protein
MIVLREGLFQMRHGSVIDELLHPRLLILLLLIVAGTIYLHVILGEDGKKDVDFGAAIVSGIGIVYTVLLAVQTRRISSAARFAERWNDATFTERRRGVGAAIRGEKNIADVDSREITAMLNFFEEMSITIQMGEAQDEMLRKFFKSVVVQSAAVFKPWIEERQKAQPTIFREYLKLVEKWNTD